MVITSYQYGWNTKHSNWICWRHHLTLFYPRWCIRDSLLAPCGVGMHWTLHCWTLPGLGKNPSAHGQSPTTPLGCVLTDGSILFWASREPFFHLQSVTCLLSHLSCNTFPFLGLIWCVALYTILHSSLTILVRVYLLTHKLPLWRQCRRYWHTLMQFSVEPKPFLFFGTSWGLWCQSRLGLHTGGPTLQYSPAGYIYLCSAPQCLMWACCWIMPVTIVE